MATYVIDTETTGMNEPEVIELAWAEVDVLALEWFSPRRGLQRYLPSKPSELGAMATHHISLDLLQDCPPSSEATLPPDVEYIIGHNVDFDWKALGSPPVKRICTQALAQMLYPGLDSYRLGALMYHLRPDIARERLKDAHSADADVINCQLILAEMLNTLTESGGVVADIEHLWTISERARVPKIMRFGKHKGQRIAEVPRAYASWYERQEDTDPYLLQAFREAGLLGGKRR